MRAARADCVAFGRRSASSPRGVPPSSGSKRGAVMVVAAMVGLAGYYNEQAVEMAATQPAPSTIACALP